MYESEEQQIEAIKKWFSDNGRQTIITLVAIVVLFFAGRIYLDNQQQHRESASVKYMELLSAVQDEFLGRTASNGHSSDQPSADEALDLKRTTAVTLAREFVEVFPKSAQAPFAAMSLGGYAADDGEFEKALTWYDWAIEATTPSSLISQLSSLRAARLEIASGKVDLAIQRLNALESRAEFERLRLSLLGDAALANEDKTQARLHYEAARAVKKKDGTELLPDAWVDMKYFDLVIDTRALSTGIKQAEFSASGTDEVDSTIIKVPEIDDTQG